MSAVTGMLWKRKNISNRTVTSLLTPLNGNRFFISQRQRLWQTRIRTSKEQFHCDDCGICRVGGRDKFFHCQNCGACYETALRDKHSCIDNSTKNSCPIYYEYLFDSVKVAHVMRCGHTMHRDCYEQMIKEQQYRCPICSKSTLDMSYSWRLLDREISATQMPVEYNFEVTVLCNDCNKRSTTMFHILGHKCAHCGSYNTRRISTPQDPVSETE